MALLFEVNKVVVEFCKKNGLNVNLYIPEEDNYNFHDRTRTIQTFTMNHVLEHLEQSSNMIIKIFESCHRLGIIRIVFTVPGHKGISRMRHTKLLLTWII
jgi:hypothetical protein